MIRDFRRVPFRPGQVRRWTWP